MPPTDEARRRELLSKLTEQHARGDSSKWEAGGQSNFMITASRLGMRVASAANVGDDVYGKFLIDVLRVRNLHLRMHPPHNMTRAAETLPNSLPSNILITAAY